MREIYFFFTFFLEESYQFERNISFCQKCIILRGVYYFEENLLKITHCDPDSENHFLVISWTSAVFYRMKKKYYTVILYIFPVKKSYRYVNVRNI